jgi:hypothetical protein
VRVIEKMSLLLVCPLLSHSQVEHCGAIHTMPPTSMLRIRIAALINVFKYNIWIQELRRIPICNIKTCHVKLCYWAPKDAAQQHDVL